MMGNRTLFFSALRALRDEFGDAATQTQADVNQGDLEAGARRMHKLRGVAGNASAESIAALATEVEDALVHRSVSRLGVRLRALQNALDEVISGLPLDIDASGSEQGDVSVEVDLKQIQRLKEALAKNEMSALRQFELLGALLVARHGGAETRPLNEAMDRLEFAEALKLLKVWYPD